MTDVCQENENRMRDQRLESRTSSSAFGRVRSEYINAQKAENQINFIKQHTTMAKLQTIIALCVIATVLASMIAVDPAQAETLCYVDEESCRHCCHTKNGLLWTATLDNGICKCSRGGSTEIIDYY